MKGKLMHVRRIGLCNFIILFLFTVVGASLALQMEAIEEEFIKGGVRLEDGIDNPVFRRLLEHVERWPESNMVLAEDVDVGEILNATVIPRDTQVWRDTAFGRVRLRWTDDDIINVSSIPVRRDILAGRMFATYALYETAELAQLRAFHDFMDTRIVLSGDYPESVVISPPELPDGIIITDRSFNSKVTIIYHNLLFTLSFQPREGGVVPDEDIEYVRSLLAGFIRDLSKQQLVESKPRPPIAHYLGREIISIRSARVGQVHLEYDAKYDEYKKKINIHQGSSRRLQKEGRELVIMINLPWPADTIRMSIRAENELGHVLEDDIVVEVEDWTKQMLLEEDNRQDP